MIVIGLFFNFSCSPDSNKPDNPETIGIMLNNPSIISNSSIELSWNSEDNYQYYEIYYGESSQDYNVSLSNISGKTYTINNLNTDVSYYFVIKGIQSDGSEITSNEINISTDNYYMKTYSPSNVQDNPYYRSSRLIYNSKNDKEPSGTVIIGNVTHITADHDFYIQKLDIYGNVLWTKTYSGSGNETKYDEIESIEQTFDSSGNPNGFIATGDTSNYGVGQSDLFVIKIDIDGNILWEKTYGGIKDERGKSVKQVFNNDQTTNGYIVGGITYSFISYSNSASYWIIRLDESGNVIWEKTYNNDGAAIWHSPMNIILNKDSSGNTDSYVIGGRIYFSPLQTCAISIIKIDLNGNILWEKNFGNNTSGQDFNNIEQIMDKNIPSGYILSGSTTSVPGSSDYTDILIIKLDNDGNQVWQKAYIAYDDWDGISINDHGGSIKPVISNDESNNGFIFVGHTESFDRVSYSSLYGWYDNMVLKLNADGDIEWSRCYGQLHAIEFSYTDIFQTYKDNNFNGYIFGTTSVSSHPRLVKIDNNGKIPGYSDDYIRETEGLFIYNIDIVCNSLSNFVVNANSETVTNISLTVEDTVATPNIQIW